MGVLRHASLIFTPRNCPDYSRSLTILHGFYRQLFHLGWKGGSAPSMVRDMIYPHRRVMGTGDITRKLRVCAVPAQVLHLVPTPASGGSQQPGTPDLMSSENLVCT